MAPEKSESAEYPISSREELDAITNRIAAAFAKREALVRSWTDRWVPGFVRKTDEELAAEDAALFKPEPAHLGVGAEVPADFLSNNARSEKALRAKFFPGKALKGSKARDAEEKAASAKRGLREETSDEEEGRSALGRAKRTKTSKKGPVENIFAVQEDEERMPAIAQSSASHNLPQRKKQKIGREGQKLASSSAVGPHIDGNGIVQQSANTIAANNSEFQLSEKERKGSKDEGAQSSIVDTKHKHKKSKKQSTNITAIDTSQSTSTATALSTQHTSDNAESTRPQAKQDGEEDNVEARVRSKEAKKARKREKKRLKKLEKSAALSGMEA